MSNGRPSVHGTVSLPAEFETLHVGTALYDPETGAILDANSRLEELYGYTTAELRELTADELSANTGSHRGAATERRIRAAAAGDPQRFEWRIKRADGELRWVSVDLTEITIDGRPLVLAEVTDITEYKHNDRRVSLFHRLLRHNLRNDLNVVLGFTTHIRDIAETDAVETAAGKIDTAARDLSRVSDSVRQIETAITRERTGWRRQSAADAVGEVVDAVDASDTVDAVSAVEPSEVLDHVSVAERTPMWIAVDEAFDHALTHAIENAIVHADGEPTVEVVVDESPNTGRVEIRVEDEGPPIPRMEIEALDEDTETTATSHGSGVGLFVMKWCIESLGGELKIERRSEGGNTVYFYLPPKEPPGTGV